MTYKEKVFLLSVIFGIIMAMLSMYICLDSELQNIKEEVEVSVLGQYNTTCTIHNVNNRPIIACTIPDYDYLKEHLKKERN